MNYNKNPQHVMRFREVSVLQTPSLPANNSRSTLSTISQSKIENKKSDE